MKTLECTLNARSLYDVHADTDYQGGAPFPGSLTQFSLDGVGDGVHQSANPVRVKSLGHDSYHRFGA